MDVLIRSMSTMVLRLTWRPGIAQIRRLPLYSFLTTLTLPRRRRLLPDRRPQLEIVDKQLLRCLLRLLQLLHLLPLHQLPRVVCPIPLHRTMRHLLEAV